MHTVYTFLKTTCSQNEIFFLSNQILVFNFNGVIIIENFDIGNFDDRKYVTVISSVSK